MGGSIGILIIIGLTMVVAKLGVWSMTQGVVIDASISVASTMVFARLLSDSEKLGTTFGRVMIGITLMDLAGTSVLHSRGTDCLG